MAKDDPKAKSKAKAELDLMGATALRDLTARFAGNIPAKALKGSPYQPEPGDGVSDAVLDLPDGTYRVSGSDWLVMVEDGAAVQFERANAVNKFGGDSVIEVSPHSGEIGVAKADSK